MTSVYDLPSVQTLGKGEGGRESGSSPSGKEYVIAEVKFAFQSPRSFRLLITWPPGLLQREREREREKRFFPLNFNIYIYLDNRTSKVFLLISKKKCAARAKLLLLLFFLLISKKKVCCTCKVVFLLIRSIVVAFYRSRCFQIVFSITRFYIFFKETINIKESFAFSPG